jgi:hypothetical protein
VELLDRQLNMIYERGSEWDEWRKITDISFEGITRDDLRDRIATFNNLIVRLPLATTHNRIASLHIFKDWKAFVDGAVA